MINIAVCDDDSQIINLINDKVSLFFDNLPEKFDFKITNYKKGSLLLQKCNKEYYDIFLLDIEMPDTSGFDIAEQIRRFNPYSEIIFVTAHDNLVFESIKYKPFRFIRKEDLEQQLNEAMNACIENYRLNMSERVFSLENGVRTVQVQQIRFFDAFGHNINMYLNDGAVLKLKNRSTSLNLLENELKSHGFIRTHRSYLVNCRSIYVIHEKKVILKKITSDPPKSDVFVYLSRDRVDEVKLRFQMFLRRESF